MGNTDEIFHVTFWMSPFTGTLHSCPAYSAHSFNLLLDLYFQKCVFFTLFSFFISIYFFLFALPSSILSANNLDTIALDILGCHGDNRFIVILELILKWEVEFSPQFCFNGEHLYFHSIPPYCLFFCSFYPLWLWYLPITIVVVKFQSFFRKEK